MKNTEDANAGSLNQMVNCLELRWYQEHGRHRDRIRRDAHQKPYVVGDWSWNRNYPQKQECVEPSMERAGIYGS